MREKRNTNRVNEEIKNRFNKRYNSVFFKQFMQHLILVIIQTVQFLIVNPMKLLRHYSSRHQLQNICCILNAIEFLIFWTSAGGKI